MILLILWSSEWSKFIAGLSYTYRISYDRIKFIEKNKDVVPSKNYVILIIDAGK